jgi:hypothetical protein
MLVIEEPVIIRSWGDSERLDYVLPPGTHTLCELQDILNDQAGYEAWIITDDGVLKGPHPRRVEGGSRGSNNGGAGNDHRKAARP